MIVRTPYRESESERRHLRTAARLEWLSIAFLLSIGVVMYLAMGGSQAMKTAWIEDVLSLIPPILYLVAVRVARREPTIRFPYGYQRAVGIAFLGAAVSLCILALYMVYDAAHALATLHHPTIGSVTIFGHSLWQGWTMIAALVYSVIPPVVLGRLKMKPAKALHEKTLHADAAMNKADWMTALAAAVGVLGIGLGLWWADSVAALVIGLEVLRDGVRNVRGSVSDLCDQRPTTVEGEKPCGIERSVRERLKALDWVADADVRFRSEGRVFVGNVHVVPRDPRDLIARVAEARAVACEQDHVWDVVVQPVEELFESRPEEARGERGPDGAGGARGPDGAGERP